MPDTLSFAVASLTLDAPATTSTSEPALPTHIHHLPAELLLSIFTVCGSQDLQFPHTQLETCVAISHVCSRWRQVALRCAEMWAGCFDVEMPSRWMTEVVERSRAWPVELVLPSLTKALKERKGEHFSNTAREIEILRRPCQPRFWMTSPNKELFQEVIKRCSSFTASLSDEDSAILAQPGIKERLPALEKLSLGFPYIRQTLTLDDQGIYNTRQPWSLWSLTLRRCSLNLDATCLSSLQELSIRGVAPSAAFTADGWLRFLQSLPHLRSLHLSDAIAAGEVYQSDSRPKDVSLPILEWLYIDCPFQQSADLLHRLVVPRMCDVNLYIYSLWSLSDDAFTRFVGWMKSRFTQEEPTLGTWLGLEMTESKCVICTRRNFQLEVDFGREYNDDEEQSIANEASFDPDELFHELIGAIRKPAAFVTDLILRLDYTCEVQNFWAFNFRPFVSVTRILLSSMESFQFMLPAFETGTYVAAYDVNEQCWTDQFLFPALEKLSFREVDFRFGEDHGRSLGSYLVTLVQVRDAASSEGLASSIAEMEFIECKTKPRRKERREMESYGVRGLRSPKL
ncbi:hypothetical protein GALMADRAFT_242507 [Galerina marginata CBS 339.88]|uniref:Uncharacterized protein n=1 Tax=Galerina marginata (strain CBS 339.88) TaxID=685588 RepID=A0A067TJW2_GALM3|nr:hypothetical protein GALMADRAFT_242507 [Galerina marginata CBS 339.88]